MTTGPLLPAFSLATLAGEHVSFPGPRPALVGFVKDDCPTCHLVAPLLQALYAAVGERVDFRIAGQTRDGNRSFVATHALSLPLLDDSRLKVSFAYDIDTVPTLILAGADGREQARAIGFAKDDWRALAAALGAAGVLEPLLATLPDWRPGCGSLSVDPLLADRLRAEAENSPLRARRIEIAPADDEHEFMFDQGFTDGLPVVPPTPERVLRMLAGTRRQPQDVVAVVPPNMGQATVEKVAIAAVMAGCRPAYLPVVLAAVEAVCNDTFNAHGVMATTMGASPVLVVNGPVRHRIGMNMGLGALGQGNRANATIGRALRLLLRNVGGARPGGTERSTLGNPMKFTMCFAEWEERAPWPPLHVERGFARDDSVVTAFAMTSGPTLIADQASRSGDALAGSLGLGLESAGHVRAHRSTNVLLVVCPEHVDTLVRDGYDRGRIRARVQQVTARPARELVADAVSGVGISPAAFAKMSDAERDGRIPKFRSEGDIHIVVAGGDAGKFSAAFHGWGTGSGGSEPVSCRIEEV
jgi:thiol-disulfide isomerase/thioredoxin